MISDSASDRSFGHLARRDVRSALERRVDERFQHVGHGVVHSSRFSVLGSCSGSGSGYDRTPRCAAPPRCSRPVRARAPGARSRVPGSCRGHPGRDTALAARSHAWPRTTLWRTPRHRRPARAPTDRSRPPAWVRASPASASGPAHRTSGDTAGDSLPRATRRSRPPYWRAARTGSSRIHDRCDRAEIAGAASHRRRRRRRGAPAHSIAWTGC